MNPTPRRILSALLVLAFFLPGCKRGPDRQIVYPARRGSRVQVDTSNGVHVKAPGVNVHVPVGPPMDPTHGIDVPMIDPD